MSATLKEGDQAPDFTLKSQDGREVSLRETCKGKDVVLYFYPKDFTTGCTAEAKAFSANYDRILEMGADVLGVSSDAGETHSRFANECGVKFALLSDDGGRVRELYGVRSSMGLFPGRVTFVIDSEGVVRRIFSSQLNPKRHVDEAIKALETVRSKRHSEG